ncbi:hypothetical protein PLESTF_000671300 [Pleodorina starrii]|nr:hypothetical protein PLESTF_000671300 [Pleodorina starrii]
MVAYFDAAFGVSTSSSGYWQSSSLRPWTDADSTVRPHNTLRFNGNCSPASAYVPGANGMMSSTPVVAFDGASCYAALDGDLPPSWDAGATSAFTAVWIGRFARYPQSQMLLSLSHTSGDDDRVLYWSTDTTMISSSTTGTALRVSSGSQDSLPPPPTGQWTMEVLSRSNSDSTGSGMEVSYYRYGLQTGELVSRRFPTRPCEVGSDNFIVGADPWFSGMYFAGEMAAVLLYNRSLSESEVRMLGEQYRPRFGGAAAPNPWWSVSSPPQSSPPPYGGPTSPPPVAINSGYNNVSCFKDPWSQSLPFLLEDNQMMTIDRCASLARLSGFSFFGLQGGTRCFGGNDLSRAQSFGVSYSCKVPCSGNASEACGGMDSINIYFLLGARSPPPSSWTSPVPWWNVSPSPSSPAPSGDPISSPPEAINSGYSYVACFDDPWHQVMPYLLEDNQMMTVGRCASLAHRSDFPYLGLQGGTRCLGGYDLSRAQNVNYTCVVTCGGNVNESCGGMDSISIYFSQGGRSPPPSSWTSPVPWWNVSPSPSSPAPSDDPISSPPEAINSGYSYMGCFWDPWRQVFPHVLEDPSVMTVARCASVAKYAGFPYFGVEAGTRCLGGYDLSSAQYFGVSYSCVVPCSGNANESCGGMDSINIYLLQGAPSPPPSYWTSPVPLWNLSPPSSLPPPSDPPSSPPPVTINSDPWYVGCYQDSALRALPNLYDVSETQMTIDSCRHLAQRNGMPYYGLEYGRECYGGSDVMRVLTRGESSNCTMPCTGNASQICGGLWALSVYATTGTPPPPTALTPGCYIGCFQDRADWRALPEMYDESANMTIDRCREIARDKGYAYFGVEAGTQCFGGNDMYRAEYNGRSAECNWRCAGDDSKICGGDWAISVYHTYDPVPPPSPPSPTPPPPSLRKEDLVGCYWDAEEFRALPTLLSVSEDMTVAICRKEAEARGFYLYGLEAGRECYGGDNLTRATALGLSTQCDWPCAGESCEVCGGNWAILIYTTTPQPAALTPSPALPYGPPPPPPGTPGPYGSYGTYSASPAPAPYWPAFPEDFPPSTPNYGPSWPPFYNYRDPPPVYGARTSPPHGKLVRAFLPERLRPEVAYFDAIVGVTYYSDSTYDNNIVLLWKDVFVSERPGNLLFFDGQCRMSPPSSGSPSSPGVGSGGGGGNVHAAIHFDGKSCVAVLDDQLPVGSWDASSTGAFTAVWIGRFNDSLIPLEQEQAILSLSRTPYDFDRELYWTNNHFFMYSHETGFSVDDLLPAPPANAWTMKVVSRGADEGKAGGVSMSYHWYGKGEMGFHKDEVSTYRFRAAPSELGPDKLAIGADYRDGNKFFGGDVAVVLLYNRQLSEGEVRDLAAFYSVRFGWPRPNGHHGVL